MSLGVVATVLACFGAFFVSWIGVLIFMRVLCGVVDRLDVWFDRHGW